ncbi:hypothetical protein HCA78_13815 [Listeria booriae]|uniref:Two component regulator three Y domain-containing protein n=1 Tax=Listeria booriae TaxID=1552123 RepID=A0A7X1A6D1_9LIST|nr:hypothetical protein [Listeria booriae]MBC2004857.1 hypothetical protein [Listeria booriae]MBC2371888.1 hypothetical protein [Listeria booriae]MBC2390223.1 hypothetical protein [Listeria booriae]
MRKWLTWQIRKIYFELAQNKRKMSNGIELTYILKTVSDSDSLVVVFSALSPRGKSVYNHVRSLNGIPCNRLYILDNFGYKKRGVFYLGEKNGLEVRDAVEELIDDICRHRNIKTKIFAGSCKGGTAAIYFGLRSQASQIIVGAPMYYINDCLKIKFENYRLRMIDETDPYGEDKLNGTMKNTVQGTAFQGHIYMQYSKGDEYFLSQINPFIDSLRKEKFSLITEEANYTEHQFCSFYFAKYLKKILTKEKVGGL